MDQQRYVITGSILNKVADIDRFRGRWKAFGDLPLERLEAIKQEAMVAAVAATLRLGGVKVKDDRVRSLLIDPELPEASEEEKRLVKTESEALNDLHESFARMELSEATIKKFHEMLYSQSPGVEGGAYKTSQNDIGSLDKDGEMVDLILATSRPEEVSEKVSGLLARLEADLMSPTVHPLLAIAVFWYDFMLISPFQEGNGRMARLLARFLLLKAGYLHTVYSAPEKEMEKQLKQYCEQLRLPSKDQDSSQGDLTEWVDFILGCLQADKEWLSSQLDMETRLLSFSELDEKILSLSMRKGRVTISEVENRTEVNRNTIKVRLRELVSHGYLQRHGQGKGTWYTCSL